MDSRQTVKIGWALGWYCALYLFIREVARSGPHSNAGHTARLWALLPGQCKCFNQLTADLLLSTLDSHNLSVIAPL